MDDRESSPNGEAVEATPSLDNGLLLECVVTTTAEDGSTHLAPMGPIVDPRFERALLRPFRGSTTLENLRRERRCVLNITDDVELIAAAALRRLPELPPLEATPDGGQAIADACRWYTLRVQSIDDLQERTQILCDVTGGQRRRDFVGINRAMNAVIEAAILATRLHLLPLAEINRRLTELGSPVEKTGGPRERRAMALVLDYVAENTQP